MHMILLGLLAAVLLLSGGCATCTDCGSINESHAVGRIFEDGRVLPGHNYYYHGEREDPEAILAIDDSYRLEGRFWTPIDITREQLEQWARYAKRRAPYQGGSTRYQGRFWGAEILDPQGRKVGVWYSIYDWGVFKFSGDNVILAYSPSVRPGFELDTWRDNER